MQTAEAAAMAIEAGTDGLAHMFSNAPPSQALIDRMLARDVFVIPTLSVFQNTGQVPPEHRFELTDDWREIEVDLNTVGDCDTGGLMAVIFSAVEPGAYSFQLDEVGFR